MNITIENDTDYNELVSAMTHQVQTGTTYHYGKHQPNHSVPIRSVMMHSSFLRAGAVALIKYLDEAGDAGDGKLKKLTATQINWLEAQQVVLKDLFGITEGIDY